MTFDLIIYFKQEMNYEHMNAIHFRILNNYIWCLNIPLKCTYYDMLKT